MEANISAETVWATISLKDQRKLVVGSYYRPPDSKSHSIDDLESVLSFITEKFRNNPQCTIILGETLTRERPMGHICPMFFSCTCYINITKKNILNSRKFYYIGSFVHRTKKNYAIHPFFVSHLAILFNQLQNLWNCEIMGYFDKTKILIKSK